MVDLCSPQRLLGASLRLYFLIALLAVGSYARFNFGLGLDDAGDESVGSTGGLSCGGHSQCTVEFTPYSEIYNQADLAAGTLQGSGVLPSTSSSMKPTPWMLAFESPECTLSRGHDYATSLFIYCVREKNIIYSPSMKLAYIKTGKAASTAFMTYFKSAFWDAQEVNTALPGWMDKMPTDLFYFTFVREPIMKQLAGYAEIDAVHMLQDDVKFENASFKEIDRSVAGGSARYMKFLEDLTSGGLGLINGSNVSRHASSQLASTCTHGMHFIGHLENLDADWNAIQEMAGVPMVNRSAAIPKKHEREKDMYVHYAEDEAVLQTREVLLRMCRVYRSDFACLGYEMPSVCKRVLRRGGRLDKTIDVALQKSRRLARDEPRP